MIRVTLFLLFFTMLMVSCEDPDPEPSVPSYLRIEKINFANSQPAIYGSSGASITDAWVFANEQLIGVFELPCEVPILSTGNTDIRVGAGIKVNGISATRAINPFYTYYTEEVTLYADSVITIEPSVDYALGTTVVWSEGFEDSSPTFDTIATSDVRLERLELESPDNTYNGFIAKATLTPENPGLKALTNANYPLPAGGTPVYFEFDFSCNQQIVLSIIQEEPSGLQQEQVLIFLNPTSEDSERVWKHLYLDLTDQVGFAVDADKFGMGITAFHNSSNDTGFVFIDNLKLVYR